MEVLFNHEKKNLKTEIRIACFFVFHHMFFQQNAHFKPPVLFGGTPPKLTVPPPTVTFPIGNFIFQPSIFRCKLLNFWGCSFPMDAPLKETTRCFKNMMEKCWVVFQKRFTYGWKPAVFPIFKVVTTKPPWRAKVQRLFRRVGGRSCRVCAAFNRELSGSLLGAYFLWWMWLKYLSPSLCF